MNAAFLSDRSNLLRRQSRLGKTELAAAAGTDLYPRN